MGKIGGERLVSEGVTRGVALCALLVLGAMVVAGPSGLLAWRDYHQQLEQRQTELVRLRAERDQLKNRVALLDPRHVDPDLAGELLRRDLNVVHPDEVVMMLR
ncbi:MAG: septum formation initiator family protein [Proteobacteria bacterium]|nr:septum formation initiator family protein [Pseudomonadota bacterium]